MISKSNEKHWLPEMCVKKNVLQFVSLISQAIVANQKQYTMLPYDLIIFQIQYSNTYYINGLTGDFE